MRIKLFIARKALDKKVQAEVLILQCHVKAIVYGDIVRTVISQQGNVILIYNAVRGIPSGSAALDPLRSRYRGMPI